LQALFLGKNVINCANAKIALWLEFKIRFLENAVLPKWKGNIVRGSIGYVLRKLSCRNKACNDCYSCQFNSICAFGYLYKNAQRRPPGFLSKYRYFPNPYALKPPLTRKEEFRKDDTLTFGIVLFGTAITFSDRIVTAVQELGKLGLGRKNCRGRFEVEQLCAVQPFRRTKYVLLEDGQQFSWPSSECFIYLQDLGKRINKQFALEFISPARIVQQGKFTLPQKFYDIFGFAMRKYSNIVRAYCCGQEMLNYKALKKFALNEVELVKKEREKIVKITYTKHGKPRKELYFVGRYIFRSSSALPKDCRKVLNFCLLSNVGKRTTYGHGWYRIVPA